MRSTSELKLSSLPPSFPIPSTTNSPAPSVPSSFPWYVTTASITAHARSESSSIVSGKGAAPVMSLYAILESSLYLYCVRRVWRSACDWEEPIINLASSE
jgi:hypothetical protein